MIAFRCSYCGEVLQVPDHILGKPVRCSGCGKVSTAPAVALTVPPVARAREPRPPAGSILTTPLSCLSGCGVMLLCGFLLVVVCVPRPDPNAPAVSSAPKWSAVPGADCQLRVPMDMKATVNVVTDRGYKQYEKSGRAGDVVGMDELIRSGDLITVPRGTKARILGISFGWREVRIADGPHAGFAGWVEEERCGEP